MRLYLYKLSNFAFTVFRLLSSSVIGFEIDPNALSVAQKNLETLELDREIDFVQVRSMQYVGN